MRVSKVLSKLGGSGLERLVDRFPLGSSSPRRSLVRSPLRASIVSATGDP